MMRDVSGEVSDMECDPKSNFPRIHSQDEEKAWVTEARRRTSPEFNIRCSCLICGIMHRKEELITVKGSGLLSKRELLSSSLCYKEIPSAMFSYGDLYCELNGLVIDRNGLLKDTEGHGEEVDVGYMCITCQDSLRRDKLPSLALPHWPMACGRMRGLYAHWAAR